MQDKTYNLISTICFGHPLIKGASFIKLDVWDYEKGIEFFISFFLYDMPTGQDVLENIKTHFIQNPISYNYYWKNKHIY